MAQRTLQKCIASQGEGQMRMNTNQIIMDAQVKSTARCKMYKTLMVIAMTIGMMQAAGAMAADWQVYYKAKFPSGSTFKCYIEISSIAYLDDNKVRAWEKCGWENVEILTEIDCKERREIFLEARPILSGDSISDKGAREAAEFYNQDAGSWKYMSTSDISIAGYNAFCKRSHGKE
jgi:hypothetical protein